MEGLDDDHLVWLGDGLGIVTDLGGTVVQRATLGRPPGAVVDDLDPDSWAQWVGPVSPDGRTVAGGQVSLTGDPGQGIVTYAIRPGDRWPVAGVPAAAGLATACPPSWGRWPGAPREASLSLPTTGDALLSGPRLLVADPSLHVDCTIWAADALDAPRHRTLTGRLFGYRTAWFCCWWRELLIGAAVAAGVLVLVRRLRRS